jgi:UDP-N-acetylmuramyl pentapeptide phosphotransferase/UDP-N-acetylglucosamine-1-phosphate transferase
MTMLQSLGLEECFVLFCFEKGFVTKSDNVAQPHHQQTVNATGTTILTSFLPASVLGLPSPCQGSRQPAGLGQ